MKTKILMIAPSSIPVYGAEAIVNTKLLQLLSNNNFEIDLISKKNKWENYPPDDNLKELNIVLNKLEIVVVDNRLTLKTIWEHFMAFITFGTVFKGAHWAYVVAKKFEGLFKNNTYDYVITKNSPSLLVGYYLKKKYGYKWVASWNDPYPRIKYPKPYGEGKEASLPWYHRKVLKIMEEADLHIFPSKRLKDYMSTYLAICKKNTLIAPHIVFKGESFERKNLDSLKILHSGNIRYPRNPRPFILAVKRLLNEAPQLLINVDFVGVYDSDVNDFIITNKLEQIISLLPPTKYQDNLKIISDYNLAMIIEAPCNEGVFLPTKVGDYMQAEIPIFTISPKDGLLNDLYKDGFIQYFADNGSEDSIFHELKKIYADFSNNNIKQGTFYEPYKAQNVLESYLSINKKW